MTCSTGLKSTPRSSDEVHTTQRIVPARSRSSISSRASRSIEPWCSATSRARSGRLSTIDWYQISAWARVFVKISVEVARRNASMTGPTFRAP